MKKSPKVAIPVIGAVAVLIALGAGYLLGSEGTGEAAASHPSPGPSAAPSKTAARAERIGGLDLKQYCKSYGYEADTEASCSSQIDLSEACNWDHRAQDLKIVFTSKDPNGGDCVTPQNKSVGGIRNMQGFCEQKFETSVSVKAGIVHGVPDPKNSWVCRTSIDKELACTWQYQKKDLEARKEDNGLWACFQ